MNKNFIPLLDAARHIEDAVTKTADYAGASHDLGEGFAPGGPGLMMAAVVNVAARDFTTEDETYKFKLQESDDNVTFTDAGPQVAVTATGSFAIWGIVSKRYVRADLDVGGTSPSITYSTDLGVHA